MEKLYFRAWLKEEKKMMPVVIIHMGLDGEVGTLTLLDLFQYPRLINMPINRVILMQGFKIGKQIFYEGDIVKYNTSWHEDKPNYKIEFYDGSIFFDGGGYNYTPIYQMDDIDELKVLGNIYENKELLK